MKRPRLGRKELSDAPNRMRFSHTLSADSNGCFGAGRDIESSTEAWDWRSTAVFAALLAPARIGMEATGRTNWFERMLAEQPSFFHDFLPTPSFIAIARFWDFCFRSQRLRLAPWMGVFSDGFLTVVADTAMRYGQSWFCGRIASDLGRSHHRQSGNRLFLQLKRGGDTWRTTEFHRLSLNYIGPCRSGLTVWKIAWKG